MNSGQFKYILNGEERNYTRSELEIYYRKLLRKYDISEPLFLSTMDSLIRRLEKYGGDPYGHLKRDPVVWRQFHKEEAGGFLQVSADGGTLWPSL